MNLGLSVAALQSRRGAGLGNEVFGLAKAYIGAQELGLRLVEPPWGLNPRRYRSELGGSLRADIAYGLARLLPADRVTTSMVEATAESDYRDVLRVLSASGQISARGTVLHESGMAGGYAAIRSARPFLRHRLLGRPSAIAAQRYVEDLPSEGIRVGVHYRRGDFGETPPAPGHFNASVPDSWYLAAIRALAESSNLPIHIVVASDSRPGKFDEDVQSLGFNVHRVARDSIGDLAALASCDLILSSVSSFSMLAIFLSDAPYAWYAPQLTPVAGYLGIWANETAGFGRRETQAAIENLGLPSEVQGRAVALGDGGQWPNYLVRYLESRIELRRRATDLIYYGVVLPSDA